MLDKDLIVFDVEASGKNPDTASIIQIGMVTICKSDLTIMGGSNSYVKPYTRTWEDGAEGVHKLTRGFLEKNGENIYTALNQFEKSITGHINNYNLATWGNGYDLQLLRNAYEYAGMEFPFSHRTWDIASFVRLYLRANKMIGKDKLGLVRCAKALGINTNIFALHDAYHDAALTAEVLRVTLSLIQKQRAAVYVLKTIMNVDKK